MRALWVLCFIGCTPTIGGDRVAAPAAPSTAESEGTLWLAAGPGDAVDLHFVRAATTPRLMELRVAYDGPRFLGAEPLDAADAADKRLVVQDEGETLRVVLISTSNLNPIDSGPLVRLRFEGEGTVDLVGSPSIFAANDGLKLGDPLALGGR